MKDVRNWLTKESLLIPILILWSLLILVKYHQYHPFLYQKIKPLFEPLILIFSLLIFILLSFGIGHMIFKFFKLQVSPLETFLFSTGLGFGILMYLTFLLGICGLLYQWIFYTLLVVIGLFTIKELWEFIPSLKKRKPGVKSKNSSPLFELSLKCILFFLLSLCLICSLTPDVAWDAAVAHLNIPKIYILAHKICFVPYNLCSNIPLNIEMLFTMVMLCVKGPILPKLVHFTFGILILLIIYSFSLRYFSHRIGLLASLIFLVNPVVIFEISIAYIDLGLSFYYLLALYGFFCWLDSNNKNWLLLMAIFSGISLGIKYTAVFGVFTLGIGILLKFYFVEHLSFPKILKKLTWFSIISFLFLLPWLIKNYLMTGNPVYPMLYSIFDGKDWEAELSDQFAKFIHAGGMGRKWLDYLMLPWNLTIHGNYGHEHFDNIINPLGLIFVPLLLFIKKIDKKIIYLLGYFFSFLFLWALYSQQMRFLLPILPLISLISAYVIESLPLQGKLLKKLYPGILVIILGIFISNTMPHTVGIGNDFGVANNLPVVLGVESKDSFLLRTFAPYDTFKYINDNLHQDVKILFLWENRGFYCDREYVSDSVFEASWILKMVREVKESSVLLKKLKEMEITHILLNKNLASIFYRDKGGVELKIIEEFLSNYTELVCFKNNVDLFKIKE
ncbi:MAG: glycosyltransferase family 39 protein [bacterium]